MDHWRRLRRLRGSREEITAAFKDSLSSSSASASDTFKFITAAVKKHPFLLEAVAAPWILNQRQCDYRGLAGFLAHLPAPLRPSRSVPALWRAVFQGCQDETVLLQLVRVYVDDLSTPWLLAFCVRDEFFYAASAAEPEPATTTLARLAVLDELFRRRPLDPSLPRLGLVEKVAQLWPLLDNPAFRRLLLGVFVKASAAVAPRPLFRVEELAAIVAVLSREVESEASGESEAVCVGEIEAVSVDEAATVIECETVSVSEAVTATSTANANTTANATATSTASPTPTPTPASIPTAAARLLQFEIQKLPKQVYVLSSQRDQYGQLGSLLAAAAERLLLDDEGLLRAMADRWSVLQLQQHSSRLLARIESALATRPLRDSTLRAFLSLDTAPQLNKPLLGHLLRHRRVRLLPQLCAAMRASPAAAREVAELFGEEEEPSLAGHLMACIAEADDLTWLQWLIECSPVGEFISSWPLPGRAASDDGGGFSLLAEHIRRRGVSRDAAWRRSVDVSKIPLDLPVADLRVLVEAFDLESVPMRLICGLFVESRSGALSEAVLSSETASSETTLSSETALHVATLIKDSQAAHLALDYFSHRCWSTAEQKPPALLPLLRLILEFKAGLRRYVHPVTSLLPSQSSSSRPFHAYLETIFPGLADPTPSADPLINLRHAFMYGDAQTVRHLQSLILTDPHSYPLLRIAQAVSVGALVAMGDFGRVVLEGVWKQICGEFEVAWEVAESEELMLYYREHVK